MTKKAVTNFIITLILSAAILLSIAVSFFHEYQPSVSQEYLSHKKNYKKIIKQRDLEFSNLLTQLESKEITVDKYIAEFNTVSVTSEELLDEYHSIKNKIKEQESVLGYTSYKNFLLGIGFPVMGFFFSILFLSIVVRNIANENKKRFYLVVSFAYMYAWGYWLVWSMLNHTQDPNRPGDFPRLYYNISLYVLPVIVFFASFFIFKYYSTIEEKLTKMIHILFKALYEDLENRKIIPEDKDVEFRKLRMEITEKVVEHE